MLRVALVLRSTDVHPVYFDLSTDEHATGVPPYPLSPAGATVFFFFEFFWKTPGNMLGPPPGPPKKKKIGARRAAARGEGTPANFLTR